MVAKKKAASVPRKKTKPVKKAEPVAKKAKRAKKGKKVDPLASLRVIVTNGFAEIRRLLDGPHDEAEVNDLVEDVRERITEAMG